MLRRLSSFLTSLAIILSVAIPILVRVPEVAFASAGMSISSVSPVRVGDTVTVGIYVNTGGASANSFDAHMSYPSGMFTPVRGSTTGSVCNIWITQPDPDSSGADISCGKPGGYTGASGLIATVYLSATSSGAATFSLSGCSVLANDGLGTDITGGCTGKTITVNALDVPTPPPANTPSPTPTGTLNPVNTPKPKTTPKPTTTPGQVGGTATQQPAGATVASDKPQTPIPTPVITPPPAVVLPSTSPTPTLGILESAAPTTDPNQKRTISPAFRDIFTSLGSLKSIKGDYTGIIALLLAMIPVLGFACAILFLAYRLFTLERVRRRTLDRLFESELSELAALEGKMDLLAEKGPKGREQYREEFKTAKEHILRQIRPDYGKPATGEKPPATPAA